MSHWKPKLLAAGGFLLAIINWLAFFGIDAKTLRDQMTAHYFFLIFAVVCSGICFSGIYYWWRNSRTTPQNIQSRLREWLERFQLSTRRITPEQTHFGWEVVLPSTLLVWLLRTHQHERYLTVIATVTPPQAQTAAFSQLSPDDKTAFWRALFLEASRSRFNFTRWSHENIERFTIENRLPITRDFSESDIIEALREMDFAASFLYNTILFWLSEQSLAPQPAVTPQQQTRDTQTPPVSTLSRPSSAGEKVDSPARANQIATLKQQLLNKIEKRERIEKMEDSPDHPKDEIRSRNERIILQLQEQITRLENEQS
jgi:hypothetical protein